MKTATSAHTLAAALAESLAPRETGSGTTSADFRLGESEALTEGTIRTALDRVALAAYTAAGLEREDGPGWHGSLDDFRQAISSCVSFQED